MRLRKSMKPQTRFPNGYAATTLLWLALRNVLATYRRAVREWREAMNQFVIVRGERFTRTKI